MMMGPRLQPQCLVTLIRSPCVTPAPHSSPHPTGQICKAPAPRGGSSHLPQEGRRGGCHSQSQSKGRHENQEAPPPKPLLLTSLANSSQKDGRFDQDLAWAGNRESSGPVITACRAQSRAGRAKTT